MSPIQEMHCSRAPHVPRVPAAEVLQLLREVPPSLRSRYCARLRLEAQRRRAAAAEGAEGAAEGGDGWNTLGVPGLPVVKLTQYDLM